MRQARAGNAGSGARAESKDRDGVHDELNITRLGGFAKRPLHTALAVALATHLATADQFPCQVSNTSDARSAAGKARWKQHHNGVPDFLES